MKTSAHITICITAPIILLSCVSIDRHEQPANIFVDKKYDQQSPLAQLINMTVYTDLDTTFILNRNTMVQIYATGEMNVELADVERRYLFQSDDMEFYFDFNSDRSDAYMNQADDYMYIFSWLDGKIKSDTISFRKQGAGYRGYYDRDLKDYVAEITFPWKYFNKEEVTEGYHVGFDIAIGDNDDDLKQKGKLAWHSTIDDLVKSTRSYGNLLLVKDSVRQASSDTIVAMFKSPVMDGVPEPLWSDLPVYHIKNMIAGYIRSEDDCAATVQTCWDSNNLYFLVKVHDPGKKQRRYERIRTMQTFNDYGWIEDSKGNKVWEMHVLDTKHAGGANKNQMIDTIIHLKAGKYTVKYISDESHAWNNWDDAPPRTPFHGIVLYEAK